VKKLKGKAKLAGPEVSDEVSSRSSSRRGCLVV
jgi:hypothetical protein